MEDLITIKNKCKGILRSLWQSENDRENPKPLQYGELLKDSGMSESTFNEWLDVLQKQLIIKKLKINGHCYYSLRKWGENIIEMESYAGKDFFGFTFMYQAGYELDLKHYGVV